MGKDLTCISYAETRSERKGENTRQNRRHHRHLCLFTTRLEHEGVTGSHRSKGDHQDSVQKESATSEFDARRWKRNLSSLMVKGGDTRPWSKGTDTKCRALASHHEQGLVRPYSVEKLHPSWLSRRAGVPQDLSHFEEREGLHRSCFYHECGELCFSCS